MFADVERRYLNDPVFKALVDTMERLIEECHTTPTEVREAAMYAQMRYEHRHPRTFMIARGMWEPR